jgi:hypothetical protein
MNAASLYREKAERYRLWARQARTPEAARTLEATAERFEAMADQALVLPPVEIAQAAQRP